jgi:hypothetical protein
VAGTVFIVLVESASAPLSLQRVRRNPPEVSHWLATLPPTTVLELPVGVHDPLLMYFSIWHWQHMANGYSGFFPSSYTDLHQVMVHFPDDESIETLKRRGIELIVMHESLMGRARYRRLTEALSHRTDVGLAATFGFPGSEQRAYYLQ